MRKQMTGVVIMLALIVVVAAAVVVQADLKATNVADAWDFKVAQFQHSMVAIYFDGTWVPFIHELAFDLENWVAPTDPKDKGYEPPETGWVEPNCTIPANTDTHLRGYMWYGLYHQDTGGPPWAYAFTETRHWSLVQCDYAPPPPDANGRYDGVFDAIDLSTWPVYPTAPEVYADCVPFVSGAMSREPCTLIYEDRVFPCSTGNCETEIVTKFLINLDQDCDGSPDANIPIPEGGLCFYAEARPANVLPGDPVWTGNPQARISFVGGEKTVNFDIQPTAVEYASPPTATAWGDAVLVEWETVSEVDNLGFNLYRAASVDGARAQLNDSLIASLAPGSPLGFHYLFLDEGVEPGVTYYYWLEDVDVDGSSSLYGPIRVQYRTFLPVAFR